MVTVGGGGGSGGSAKEPAAVQRAGGRAAGCGAVGGEGGTRGALFLRRVLGR